MKKLIIGILAHVDAGKTTLSEALLYKTGTIRSVGRVDNKDAFLDTYELEKQRGITIFSKQAQLKTTTMDITLIDTPGHVDFAGEMVRSLSILDYAILVISGTELVQPHTETLWRLLLEYNIPVFIFVNKMDQSSLSKNEIVSELRSKLSENIVDISSGISEVTEDIASISEESMEEYLDSGDISKESICEMICNKQLTLVNFGSALKLQGVDEFINTIETYTSVPLFEDKFGARVYKILRDDNIRLTFMKVLGGTLKVKDELSGEKINQIRIYSGDKFTTVNEADKGMVVAVTGLEKTYAGQGLGNEVDIGLDYNEPVLSYRLILPSEVDAISFLPKIKELEEEEPLLKVRWDEYSSSIFVEITGEIFLQILKRIIIERYNVDVAFDSGSIMYKETINAPCYGVGHFEPLRHYAEVHLVMEPLPHNSGIVIANKCSDTVLDKNWQRLIISHLCEKEYKGVLTNSPITDIKITLVAGRASKKHTEGGDFRQAVYRAVRQGLMESEKVLLEPWYKYSLSIPEEFVGRAINDIDIMKASFSITQNNDGMAILKGKAPVSEMRNYYSNVISYSRGRGRLNVELDGYYPCHNFSEVVSNLEYNPEADLNDSASSIFCEHGAGFVVPWNEVYEHMQLDSKFNEFLGIKTEMTDDYFANIVYNDDVAIGTEEIDEIISRLSNANKKPDTFIKRRYYKEHINNSGLQYNKSISTKKSADAKEYLLVDGYNVIHAWDNLKDLIDTNMEGARGKLLDILCNYQAMKGCILIVVFDAYKVKGHFTEFSDYNNIHVVYTKEAETADAYIEKFAHEHGQKHNVTVATSDGLEQLIIRGAGCSLISSREFYNEVESMNQHIRDNYLNKKEE